jgi:hypothetical protein
VAADVQRVQEGVTRVAEQREYRTSDFEAEYRAVLRTLAGSGRALELNTRLPLDPLIVSWWRQPTATVREATAATSGRWSELAGCAVQTVRLPLWRAAPDSSFSSGGPPNLAAAHGTVRS